MKLTILALFVMFSLVISACATTVQQNTQKTPTDFTPVTYTVNEEQSYQIANENVAENPKFFEIRITENHIDPEEITVAKGDKVHFSISNLVDLSRDEDEEDDGEVDDEDEEREINDLIRFEVDGYTIDEAVYQGTPTIIIFTADNQGMFTFGDMNHKTRKGILIVE